MTLEHDGAPAHSLDVRRPAFVSLRVDSLEEALAAWHERLGIPIKLRGEGYAELQTETFVLVLVERVNGPETTLGYEVDSVDHAAAELASRGFRRDEGTSPGGAGLPADAPGAGTRATFLMPGSIALEIVSP